MLHPTHWPSSSWHSSKSKKLLGIVAQHIYCSYVPPLNKVDACTFYNSLTHTHCVSLVINQGKVVLVCLHCCPDVSGRHNEHEVWGPSDFTVGKPQSPWRDPENKQSTSVFGLQSTFSSCNRLLRGQSFFTHFVRPSARWLPVLQLHRRQPAHTVLLPSAAGVPLWWPACSRWHRMGGPATEILPTG